MMVQGGLFLFRQTRSRIVKKPSAAVLALVAGLGAVAQAQIG
jgi:hypothetical protein